MGMYVPMYYVLLLCTTLPCTTTMYPLWYRCWYYVCAMYYTTLIPLPMHTYTTVCYALVSMCHRPYMHHISILKHS